MDFTKLRVVNKESVSVNGEESTVPPVLPLMMFIVVVLHAFVPNRVSRTENIIWVK